jgi:hypothetical protein
VSNHVFELCGIAQHQNGIALKNFTLPKPYGLKKQSNKKLFISKNAKICLKNSPIKIKFKTGEC